MDLLDRLEYLSKLKFSDEEKQYFSKNFQSIISMVDSIKTIDIQEQVKSNKPTTLAELRDDEPKKSLCQEQVLQNAPKQKDGCYNTPQVVE